MAITANDEPTEIEADVDKRFSSIIVDLPVQQTGTGTPSPSNPRPFTMWTDVSLYVSDTEEADEPTLAIELPTPMYGGKIDMVRGEIATLYNSKESGTDWEMTEEGQFRCQVSAYNNGDETSTNVADLYAVHYETVSNKDAYDATDDLTCGLATIDGTTYLYVNDAQYTTLDSFATHIAEEVFVFRAHIPMSDVTEPHIVYLPEGTSYVWADAGFVDYTVSGTPPLSLPNSLGKPLKAWAVEVSPYQEGSGDPSPDNVRPIHGTNQISFVTAGKNLLNIEESTIVSAGWNRIIPINLVAGTYTMSCQNQLIIGGTTRGAQIAIVRSFAGNVGSIIRRIVNSYSYGNTILDFTFTLTASESAEMVGILFEPTATGLTYAELSDMQNMIELGSTASAYVPYQGNTYTIQMPTSAGTVYGGSLTIAEDGSGQLVVDKASVDLGTLNYFYVSSGDVNAFRSNINALPVTDNSQHGITSIYPFAETRFAANMPDTSWMIDSQGRLFIRDDKYTDVPSFKVYLSGQNIVYELATPLTYSLTAPTIPTPTGTATTWATAEDGTVESMEVTYVGKAT